MLSSLRILTDEIDEKSNFLLRRPSARNTPIVDAALNHTI